MKFNGTFFLNTKLKILCQIHAIVSSSFHLIPINVETYKITPIQIKLKQNKSYFRKPRMLCDETTNKCYRFFIFMVGPVNFRMNNVAGCNFKGYLNPICQLNQ